jgi:hypothetical protein
MLNRQLQFFKKTNPADISQINVTLIMKQFAGAWRQLPLAFQIEMMALVSTMLISGANASLGIGNLQHKEYNFTNQQNTSHYVIQFSLSELYYSSRIFQNIMDRCNSSAFTETSVNLANYNLTQSVCYYGDGESKAGYEVNLFKYINGPIDEYFEACLATILDNQCYKYETLIELGICSLLLITLALLYVYCPTRKQNTPQEIADQRPENPLNRDARPPNYGAVSPRHQPELFQNPPDLGVDEFRIDITRVNRRRGG